MLAAEYGYNDILCALISHGANVNASSEVIKKFLS